MYKSDKSDKPMKREQILVLGSTEPLEIAMICEKAMSLISENKTVTVVDLITKSTKPLNFYFAERIRLIKTKYLMRVLKKNGINIITINTGMQNISAINNELNTLAEKAAEMELIAVERDIKPCRSCTNKQRNELENTYVRTYLKFEDYLGNITPECIYVYNGRFIVGNACWEISRLKKLKINFLEQIVMNKPDKYWVFEEPVHSTIYRAKTINRYINDELKDNLKTISESASEWYSKRINGRGQNFTSNQNISYDNKFPNNKIVSYFTSSEDELILLGLEDSVYGDQKQIILELAKLFSEIESIHFVVRLHPNTNYKSSKEIQRWNNFKNYLEDKYHFVEFINSSSKVNTYSLIKNSNLVLTAGSTVNLEASYLRIPSVLIGNGLYKDMEIAYTPKNYDELFSNFRLYLDNTGNSHYENSLKVGAFHNKAGLSYKFVRVGKDGKNIEVFKHQLNNSKLYGSALKFDKLFIKLKSHILHTIMH